MPAVIAHAMLTSLWLAFAPPSEVTTEEPAVTPTSYPTLFVRVSGEAIEPTALAEHLRLRLPGRTILDHRDMRGAPAEAYLYVDLRVHTQDRVTLTIIGSDGRAYDRELEMDPQDPARVLATSVATLVYSIEERSVEPTRTDVTIPEPEPTPEPAPEIEPEPTPEPTPEPKPTPEPEPEPEPEELTWQIGPSLEPGVAFGFGPPSFADALAAGGGALGLRVLSPTSPRGGSLSLALSLRTFTRTADQFALVRTRVALAAGWRFTTLRQRPTGSGFSLGLEAALGIEPWWVLREGERVRYDEGEAPLLLGVGVRVSPSWMLRARTTTFMLGPTIELAGSLAPGADWTVPGVSHERDGEREQLFRVGGLELGVGLEATVLFSPRARSR